MSEQYELQKTTVGELVAESLEAEANRMPPSHSEQAKILRDQAANFRAHQTKPVHVWRVAAPKKA
jgi:hypothetical protein